jgi:hypothetical protein
MDTDHTVIFTRKKCDIYPEASRGAQYDRSQYSPWVTVGVRRSSEQKYFSGELVLSVQRAVTTNYTDWPVFPPSYDR